jgi:hypothetical protein
MHIYMEIEVEGQIVEPVKYSSLLCMADSCLCCCILLFGLIVGISLSVYILPVCN